MEEEGPFSANGPILGLYRVQADTYDVAAMDTPDQDLYSVVELAKRNGQLAKTISPSKLPRLQEAVVELRQIEGDLSFRFNEERLPVVTGKASASMTLTCQTCDEPVNYELAADIELLLVSPVRAAALPRTADVRIIDNGKLALAELLEDELLLALPAQVCTDRECKNLPNLEFPIPQHELDALQKDAGQGAVSQESENPFAALAALKGKLEKDV